ncbi:Pre-mRNA-splicing factor ATP-dependent RNA helicase prp22 [Madurella mycetomatis]|uniref:RNA helicase n=1 Tax=Madurella mycetomatis TaxID=100816 RepID=A0A175VVR0_9PEZI|nr:Pre-mRNA-splicing factor ATP-dependent RNA helicase prp22 [Madurella mycetomatis]
MEDLLHLELVGLVSKVVSELQNHLGVVDKNLAEFTIAQRLGSDTFETFKQKMSGIGGDSLPQSLLESIDRLVRMMHPSMKAKTATATDEPDKRCIIEKDQVFSGSTFPGKELVDDSIDDALAELEALESKAHNNKPQTGKRGRSCSRSEDRHTLGKRRSRSNASDHGRFRRMPYDRDVHCLPVARRQQHDRQVGGKGDGRQEEDERIFHRPPSEVDETPVLNRIYNGNVTGIKDFGVFVSLHGVKGNLTGLVHVSRLADGRYPPSDSVKRRQPVKVKVINIDGTRIGLSMKDVDQDTGQDLAPHVSLGSGANMQPLGRGRNEHTNTGFQKPDSSIRRNRRMTSPERWEIRQLIASGVAKASDFPDLDYNPAVRSDGEIELEEDLDIEVREEEPPFLVGQTKQSLELSPIRVVKAPDGSLNRAAMSGTVLGKERAELRQQQAEAAGESAANGSSKLDISTRWNDPMADQGKPKFASDIRSARVRTTKPDNIPSRNLGAPPKDRSSVKRTDMTIKQQRESLPIFAFRDQLIDAIRQNQILIVVGETGSGKTTQLTQYLAEAGFATSGIIGCTQPRRVAAMSVAKRVAEEVGCILGEEVGYSIRFEDYTSPATKIKFMTDGTLQREILLDPDLRKYSVIILDEAHERTIATDVLFALLKRTLNKRPDLKVISTSATLDAEKFSSYFNNAPIFTIPGRTFPVEILYSRDPESDYLDAALTTVMEVHLTEPSGDILLFLTGQEEIDTSCEVLSERMKALGPGVPELIILPMYSALPPEMQSRIFEPAPPGGRKVVIATNIAETSITIDNIYYVIDPGFVKQDAYDPKLGMDSLIVTPISQAQANQRAGRAGRTGPGKCFRLYTEAAYQSEMLPSPIPAIQRQNVCTTILMLKAMGINDLLHFDFMDPPPVNTMLAALEELYALGALDDEGILTRLGRRIANFPLESSLAKVLIVAAELGCSDEILSIVAMLNLPNVFYRPKEKQVQADQKKAKFHDPHGDHLTLLNVYNSWKQSGYSSSWCFEHFILARSMRQAKDVREQLVKIMERYRQPIVSCGRETDRVRRALCAGYFRNAARRETEAGAGCYKTIVQGTQVYMHPSSALFGKQAEWVIYHELVLTSREYMHWTTSIEPKWLVEAAPTFFKLAGTNGNMSTRRKQERIEPLYNRFAGKDDWRLSAQRRSGRGGGGGTWG